jgi:hypothetical protein
MHKGILAGRMLEARKRVVTAAETAVSDKSLLDSLQMAQQERRPEVRALYEMEAVATIMEHLESTKSNGITVDEILAIDGLTATSKKAIEAHFNGPTK